MVLSVGDSSREAETWARGAPRPRSTAPTRRRCSDGRCTTAAPSWWGRGDDEMAEIFRRWLATRSKPVTPIGGVTLRSLDSAWTVFLERWNTATGAAFVRKLEVREATHARMALGLWPRRFARCCGSPIAAAASYTFWMAVRADAGVARGPTRWNGWTSSKTPHCRGRSVT